MKYWKGKPGTGKAGFFGTMADNGYVPDSIEATQQEYLDYVSTLPVFTPKKTLKEVLLVKGIITQIEHDEVI